MSARVVLGRDLIALAARPSKRAAVPSAPETGSLAPLVTGVETAHYAVVANVPPSYALAQSCNVTLTIHPAPGLHINVAAPHSFRAEDSATFAFADGVTGPGRYFSAKERTQARVVYEIPLRVVGSAPHTLEGRVSVVTCDLSEQHCRSEKRALSIPLT